MYAAVTNLLNATGIPFGAGAVSSPLGGWIVVAALLVSVIILSTCVDRNPRLTRAHRGFRWMANFRAEHGGVRGHFAAASSVSSAFGWIGVAHHSS
jgi:hypothetical protein